MCGVENIYSPGEEMSLCLYDLCSVFPFFFMCTAATSSPCYTRCLIVNVVECNHLSISNSIQCA